MCEAHRCNQKCLGFSFFRIKLETHLRCITNGYFLIGIPNPLLHIFQHLIVRSLVEIEWNLKCSNIKTTISYVFLL